MILDTYNFMTNKFHTKVKHCALLEENKTLECRVSENLYPVPLILSLLVPRLSAPCGVRVCESDLSVANYGPGCRLPPKRIPVSGRRGQAAHGYWSKLPRAVVRGYTTTIIL